MACWMINDDDNDEFNEDDAGSEFRLSLEAGLLLVVVLLLFSCFREFCGCRVGRSECLLCSIALEFDTDWCSVELDLKCNGDDDALLRNDFGAAAAAAAFCAALASVLRPLGCIGAAAALQ